MEKAQKPSVERLTRKFRGLFIGKRFGVGLRPWRAMRFPVGLIADQRMAEMGEMHADLVRASCLQAAR